MEERDELEAGSEQLELLLLWLLHLDDCRGPCPHLGPVVDELGAGVRVLGVGEGGTVPGALLHEDRNAVSDELAHTVGRHCDAVLGLLDLGRDPHGPLCCHQM